MVWRVEDGAEIEVPLDSLRRDDVVAINAGETIPADGIIIQGAASVNQYILTGESQLTEKGVGNQVFASTMVLAGKIHVKVKQSGDHTVVAQIAETLNKTVDYKMSVQSWGEAISDNLAMPVLAVSALSLPFTGAAGSLAILYVGIGDAIRILAPLSLLNYLRIASKNRLLIKDGRSLELLNDIDTVVFDKTGTLTTEQPHVKNIYSCNGHSELEVLQYAAWAEHRQTHPIARAILEKAKEHELELSAIDGTIYEVGYGIKGKVSNALIRVGSVRFMKMEHIEIPDEIKKLTEDFQEEGYSSVMVAKDDHLAGVLELHNTVRPEVEKIFAQLHENNIAIYILSGDHEKPTRKMAEALNADNYFAEVFPEQKADIIEQLQKQGRKVCFVGDGINDAIAMKKARVSVSLRGASAIATDTAEIILMDGTLKNVGLLFDIAATLKNNVRTGLFTTLIPSLINIGGVFLIHSGIMTAIILDNAGLAAGVINSFLPVMRTRKATTTTNF
jgi:Cu2+-exporting ATPase